MTTAFAPTTVPVSNLTPGMITLFNPSQQSSPITTGEYNLWLGSVCAAASFSRIVPGPWSWCVELRIVTFLAKRQFLPIDTTPETRQSEKNDVRLPISTTPPDVLMMLLSPYLQYSSISHFFISQCFYLSSPIFHHHSPYRDWETDRKSVV